MLYREHGLWPSHLTLTWHEFEPVLTNIGHTNLGLATRAAGFLLSRPCQNLYPAFRWGRNQPGPSAPGSLHTGILFLRALGEDAEITGRDTSMASKVALPCTSLHPPYTNQPSATSVNTLSITRATSAETGEAPSSPLIIGPSCRVVLEESLEFRLGGARPTLHVDTRGSRVKRTRP